MLSSLTYCSSHSNLLCLINVFDLFCFWCQGWLHSWAASGHTASGLDRRHSAVECYPADLCSWCPGASSCWATENTQDRCVEQSWNSHAAVCHEPLWLCFLQLYCGVFYFFSVNSVVIAADACWVCLPVDLLRHVNTVQSSAAGSKKVQNVEQWGNETTWFAEQHHGYSTMSRVPVIFSGFYFCFMIFLYYYDILASRLLTCSWYCTD